MIGKKIKEIAENLPISSRELAKQMKMSSATLYSLYKKEYIKEEYLKRFSEISKVPVSELKENGFSFSKTELENLKKENQELKQENSFLSNKVKQLESKFDQLNDALYKKFLGLEMGKREASKKTALSEKDLSLYALNF